MFQAINTVLITMRLFIEILTFFTVSTKFIICFTLLVRKDKSPPVYLLALSFFIPAIVIIDNYFLYNNLTELAWFHFFSQLLAMNLGFVLYIYTLMLIGQDIKFIWKNYINYIPTIISFIITVVYFSYDETEKIKFYTTAFDSPTPLMLFSSIFAGLSTIYYIILALLKIKKVAKLYDDVFSEPNKIKLKFLNEMLYLLLILLIIATICSGLFSNVFSDCIIVPILTNVYGFYILYQSYNNQVVFIKQDFVEYIKELEPIKIYEKHKYENSALSSSDLEAGYAKILDYFESKKPWLQSDLKLSTIALPLEVTTHKVSEIINRKSGMNFSEFVNNYRIEHVKLLLLVENDNTKIEALAYDSGFKNKANFYKIFKEKTGFTPIQFKSANTNINYRDKEFA